MLRGAAIGGLGLAGAALIACGDDDDDDDTAGQISGGGAQTTGRGTLKVGTSSTPNFVRIPLNTADNNTPINQTFSLFNRLVRAGKSQLANEPGEFTNPEPDG